MTVPRFGWTKTTSAVRLNVHRSKRNVDIPARRSPPDLRQSFAQVSFFVLRHMRGDGQGARGRDEVLGVVGLVCAHGISSQLTMSRIATCLNEVRHSSKV